MPIYEYMCSRGHQYDKTEGFQAPTEHPCPLCGESAKRQISLPAVIFKGSGFYSTDNPKTSHGGNGASADDTTTKEDAPPPKSGGDAKPEAKAEAKAKPKTETKAAD